MLCRRTGLVYPLWAITGIDFTVCEVLSVADSREFLCRSSCHYQLWLLLRVPFSTQIFCTSLRMLLNSLQYFICFTNHYLNLIPLLISSNELSSHLMRRMKVFAPFSRNLIFFDCDKRSIVGSIRKFFLCSN